MALELPGSHRATGLVDVLDRVLDKGLVIAGDIKVSLAEVELLTTATSPRAPPRRLWASSRNYGRKSGNCRNAWRR
jgi:hypothetical protein